jgi:DNA invertase Pin-like site-specific DNA recombinase
MPTTNQHETEGQGMPRTWRAAIYLREPGQGEMNRTGHVPSIHYQGVLCRFKAAELHAEVIGEFVDRRQPSRSRPELRRLLDMAGIQAPLVNYLIVSSLDRLAGNLDEAFEVAWLLGQAGTIPILAYEDN